LQDLAAKDWAAALGGIQTCNQVEKLEQMVESLLAKLLLEDDFQELLSLHMPSLLEITKLPSVAIDNLHVFSQIVNKDLMGAATWDGVLKNLATSRKEPIIRVLEGSVNGQKLVQAISEDNSSLQLEAEKHSKVKDALHNLKKSETIQDFAKAVLQVAQMKLLPVGPKSGSMSDDLKSVASLVAGKVGTVNKECGTALARFLGNWEQATEEDVKAFCTGDVVKTLAEVAQLLHQEQVMLLIKAVSDIAQKEALHLLSLQRFVSRLQHVVSIVW
jgi:hypothetical protein